MGNSGNSKKEIVIESLRNDNDMGNKINKNLINLRKKRNNF